jgi:hypothetical protein
MRAYLHLSCLAVLLAVVLWAAPALAQPTVLGPTGLVRIPTADALTDDEWNAAYFYIDPDDGPKTNDVVANLGVATGLEVGLAATHNEDENNTLLNAKYQFAQETLNHPAIAAGVLDLTNNLETTAYVVMSKTLASCIRTGYGENLSPRLTVGLGAGEFSGLFGGISTVLGDWLAVMVEYDTKDINVGARIRVTDNIRLHVDGFNGFDGVAFGVSYLAGF